MFYSENNNNPIVIENGIEIKYSDYIKARSNETKEFYYFTNEYATILYGEKAKHGLIILK